MRDLPRNVQRHLMSSDDWACDELGHLWLPYCQMKTAARPLEVVATEG